MRLWTLAAIAAVDIAEARPIQEPVDSVALRVEDVTPTRQGGHVVFLTDEAHARIIPIHIGESEAIAIAFRLADRPTKRPVTHDLLDDVMRSLGGHVEQVHVHTLSDGVFHARVSLRRKRVVHHLDARASDAIAIALGAEIPVFMTREIYEEAGVGMDALLLGLEALERRGVTRPDADGAL